MARQHILQTEATSRSKLVLLEQHIQFLQSKSTNIESDSIIACHTAKEKQQFEARHYNQIHKPASTQVRCYPKEHRHFQTSTHLKKQMEMIL